MSSIGEGHLISMLPRSVARGSTGEPKSPERSSLWIALIWLGPGLVNGAQIVVGMRSVGMRHHWTALFFVYTVSWLVWARATPLVLALGRRSPFTRALGWRACPRSFAQFCRLFTVHGSLH
jgi:hypothetical protein